GVFRAFFRGPPPSLPSPLSLHDALPISPTCSVSTAPRTEWAWAPPNSPAWPATACTPATWTRPPSSRSSPRSTRWPPTTAPDPHPGDLDGCQCALAAVKITGGEGRGSVRAEVCHRQAVPGAQALGHQRAVARRRIAFDAEQGGRRAVRKSGRERAEVERVEDLADVALGVLRRQRGAVALAHAQAVVLAVLQPAQFGRRRQLLDVPVADARGGERALEPHRVRPGVVGAADAAALAQVEQQPHAPVGELFEEGAGGEAVDAD